MYIYQHRQAQREKVATRIKSTIIDNDYRFVDQAMMRRNSEFKYKTTFQGLCEKIQTWKKGMVNLRVSVVTSRKISAA